MVNVSAVSLKNWAVTLLESWGYQAVDARFIADSLVDANLRGVDSHGVMRLPAYALRIEGKLVDPKARPKVTTAGAVIQVDANQAAGQIAARAAVDQLTTTSREYGVATAVVHGSAHFGAAGYYARLLAERGKVAFVVSNSEPIVVPHGGRSALLGTNPLAFAAPTPGLPLSLDMATSTTAMGKVMVALSRHDQIPADWGVDKDGEPTTDPAEVVALLPVGGPKGYGLGMLVEVLGGVLSGAAIAGNLGNMYNDFDRPQDVGHWMLALDIPAFMPARTFSDRMGDLIEMVRSTPAREAERPVLVPGEPEEFTNTAREADGIPIPDETLKELAALSGRYGVATLQGAS